MDNTTTTSNEDPYTDGVNHQNKKLYIANKKQRNA